MFLVERAMQRQEHVAGSGTGWVLLVAVLACHWIEVFKALTAMIVSPWCRLLRAARQNLRATLIPLCSFLLFLLVVYSYVVLVSLLVNKFSLSLKPCSIL